MQLKDDFKEGGLHNQNEIDHLGFNRSERSMCGTCGGVECADHVEIVPIHKWFRTRERRHFELIDRFNQQKEENHESQ